jgi:hypothetical protein
MGAWRMRRLSLAILMAATAWVGTAIPEDDEFRQAVNYVFSGNIEGRTCPWRIRSYAAIGIWNRPRQWYRQA